MAAEGSIDALGQFKLETSLGALGASVNFTQSNLMMLIAATLILSLLYFGMRPKAIVPGRLQALAEIAYDGIHSMCVDQIGEEGKKFFPFVFTLFMFILFGNMLGLLLQLDMVGIHPFTTTSHFTVTGVLAIMSFAIVLVVGFWRHGLHFFSLFVPHGTPVWLLWLIPVIELISFLVRPFSLALRLFVAMMAGHVLLEVLSSFVITSANSGPLWGSIVGLPSFLLMIAICALEILVAGIQAYVFALLTSLYLNDAENLH